MKSADTVAAEAGLIDEPADPQSDARCDIYGYPGAKVPVSPAGYAAGGLIKLTWKHNGQFFRVKVDDVAVQKDATCDLKARIAALEAELAVSNERYNDTVQYLQGRLTERWTRVFVLEDENAALRAKLSAVPAIKPALTHNPFRSFRAPGFMGMARS